MTTWRKGYGEQRRQTNGYRRADGKTETNGTSDVGNGASGEFKDNGDRSGELGEMTGQSDVGGVGRFEEGGGRVGKDAMV